MADALFHITADQLNKGLRGFPVGTCRSSKVDPMEGVSYVGYPIADLAYLEPEQVAYLLLNRELPTEEQLAGFQAELKARRGIPAETLAMLSTLPRDAHPMTWLNIGLQLLGMGKSKANWEEDALDLVAQAPELVAAIFRVRSGWGAPIPSNPELDLISDFVHMLDVPGADPGPLTRLLKVFYNLHMDHGGGNLSTFTGKAIASGHASIFTSLAGAMGALSGPLHGGANAACLEQLREVGTTDRGEIEAWVRSTLAGGGKVFGYGHGVLRAEDPRATIQYALGEEICPKDPLFRTAATMREVAVGVLRENPKIANPHPNVDAVSGSLLQACGMSDGSYYTVLFGLSRITGIAAQIVDERVRMRGGKGVPIYRPKYIAEDQPPRRLS